MFDRIFTRTLGIEGDYSNDPSDRGGATRWGITEKLARQYDYVGEMRDLPIEKATAIAKKEFWDPLYGDQLVELSPRVAEELFDTAYNMGAGTATRFLQRALNAFNRNAADYPDIAVDGAVGNDTLVALKRFLELRGKLGETVLLKAMNVLQGSQYLAIAERERSQEAFVFGWINGRVSL